MRDLLLKKIAARAVSHAPSCHLEGDLQSVSCLWPHCLQANLTRVLPFSACRRLGAPHFPQVVSIRVLPRFTFRAFFSLVSRSRRPAPSRTPFLATAPPVRRRR